MLNKVIIAGRLTRDPELRHTQSDVPVASFSIANEDDFKKADGTRDVDFFDVIAWRGLAGIACKNLSKGRLIEVEGRLKVRTWKDRDGNNRRNTEIIAEKIYFVGDGKNNTSNDNHEPSTDYSADFEEMPDDDSDLPF